MNKRLTCYLVGLMVLLHHPEKRDERGLSQSAEDAILLAGAVSIAIAVITILRSYVLAKMPK